MSVFIQKKDLLDAVQKAFPIVPSKSSLQILSNFKLSYANSVLEITATDFDHSLRVTAGASGEGPLNIAVNARKIFEIVTKALPDGGVSLTVDGTAGTVLVMESEKGFRCEIAGADISDFPGIPDIENGVELSVSGSAFRDLIQKSLFAVSKDESRASLCGILWEIASDKTGMVATDGHRLGCSFITADLPVKDSFSRIISQKSVSTLVRITDSKNQDESIRVTVGDKYVSFETPSFIMVSKLIEGQYPDYSKVIPKSNPKVVVADKTVLCEAIRHVLVMANQKNHLVKFIFTSGTLEAAVTNREIGGAAKESVPIEYDGEEHTVGFNGMYFTEILDIVKTQKVRIEMNTQISACLIFPEYEDEKEKTSEDLFLIMPLRIMDDI
jgi:DNA polymerase-3 subunit beta